MSAVAALAVASPAAIVAVSDLSENAKPPTQHRQFVQAAVVTDLPNELMSALSQGLSQFGINLPPLPTSLLTGSGSSAPTTLHAGAGHGAVDHIGVGNVSADHIGVGNVSVDHTRAGRTVARPAWTHLTRRPPRCPTRR